MGLWRRYAAILNRKYNFAMQKGAISRKIRRALFRKRAGYLHFVMIHNSSSFQSSTPCSLFPTGMCENGTSGVMASYRLQSHMNGCRESGFARLSLSTSLTLLRYQIATLSLNLNSLDSLVRVSATIFPTSFPGARCNRSASRPASPPGNEVAIFPGSAGLRRFRRKLMIMQFRCVLNVLKYSRDSNTLTLRKLRMQYFIHKTPELSLRITVEIYSKTPMVIAERSHVNPHDFTPIRLHTIQQNSKKCEF